MLNPFMKPLIKTAGKAAKVAAFRSVELSRQSLFFIQPSGEMEQFPPRL